jgi:hypothetical protein
MGSVGSAYDNAMAESFVATLKTELVCTEPLDRRGSALGGRSLSIWKASTNPQVNTPLNDSDQPVPAEEIEVIDPTHPLFGRRFEVLCVHDSPGSPGYVFVSYRGYSALRIELKATDLAPSPRRPSSPATKLTSQAVIELAQLADQCEVLYAQPTQGHLEKALRGTPHPGHRGDVHHPYRGDR